MVLPLACAAFAYGVTSIWESYAHRTILHAHPRQAKAWSGTGRIGTAMRRARFNHLVHHKLACAQPWTRERLLGSEHLSQQTIQQLQETDFGASINATFDALCLFAAPPLLLILPLYLLAAPRWLPIGFLIALVPFLLTKFVHPHLHCESSNLLGRVLEPLREYHAEHHRRPCTNFNLLPGGDQLLRTHGLRRARWGQAP